MKGAVVALNVSLLIKSLMDEQPCRRSGMCQIMAASSLSPLLAAHHFSLDECRCSPQHPGGQRTFVGELFI